MKKEEKHELLNKLKALENLTTEERSYLIDLLHQKKYGLVWEDKPEDVEEQLRHHLPVFADLHVQFQYIRAHVHRLFHGRNGIFRHQSSGAAMALYIKGREVLLYGRCRRFRFAARQTHQEQPCKKKETVGMFYLHTLNLQK